MKHSITRITVMVIISLLSQSCLKFIAESMKSLDHKLEQNDYVNGYPEGVEPEDVLDYYFVYTIDGVKYCNRLYAGVLGPTYGVSAGYIIGEDTNGWVYIGQDTIYIMKKTDNQTVHNLEFVMLKIPPEMNDLYTAYYLPPEKQRLVLYSTKAVIDSCNVTFSQLDKAIIAGSFEMFAHYTDNDDNVTHIKLENGLFKSRLDQNMYEK